MRDDFYGLNQTVRWIGYVEDNRDPSQLGRCKVRILGWYSDDENLAPTDCLPWAQAQFSPGVKSFTVPKVGEWVSGYFLDGKMAQHPVYDGVLPGVNFTLTDTVRGAPRSSRGITLEERDTPSTNRLARGEMRNSLIDRANQTRDHVCDISPEIRRAVAIARFKFSQLISKIRAVIRKFIEGLNLDPSGEFKKTSELLKWVAERIKYVTDLLAEAIELKNEVLEVIRIIRAFIDFILGLPAKLFKLLSECLARFLDFVKAGIAELISAATTTVSGGVDETGISELVSSAESIYKDSQTIINQTAELITVPAQIAAVAFTPTTLFDQEQAASTVINFISNNVPNSGSIIANTNSLFVLTTNPT